MSEPTAVTTDPQAVDTQAATRAQEADPQPVELGRRIKMLRVSRGLTLKELEERGGISATHVSEIERGKASPTVGALARIAHALGVRPATLVEPRTLPLVTLKRAGHRERQPMALDRADLRPLTDPTHGVSIGAVLMRLPIAREPALEHQHEGEEWLTVLSGQAEIRIESEVHLLRTGDSLHFRAERRHAYVNPASEPAVLLLASRPRMAI
jgi:transcriptional regulator with XRE-family HTH domain